MNAVVLGLALSCALVLGLILAVLWVGAVGTFVWLTHMLLYRGDRHY